MKTAAAVSFHTAPALRVILPAKVFVPVAPEKLILPVISVVPFTVNAKSGTFNILPLFTVSPAQVAAAPRVTELEPVVAITTTSVAIGTFPPTHVAPAPQVPPVTLLVIVAA